MHFSGAGKAWEVTKAPYTHFSGAGEVLIYTESIASLRSVTIFRREVSVE